MQVVISIFQRDLYVQIVIQVKGSRYRTYNLFSPDSHSQTVEFTDIEITSDVSRFLDAVYKKDCQPAGHEDKRRSMRWAPEPVHKYFRVRFREVLQEEMEARARQMKDKEEKQKDEK